MSKETKQVRTTTSIVNPAYDPRTSGSEAIFAAGATVTVSADLADKWIANGQAEAIEAETETDKSAESEPSGKPKRK